MTCPQCGNEKAWEVDPNLKAIYYCDRCKRSFPYEYIKKPISKRIIKYDPFPSSIGYESWLNFKARQMGWHVKVVPEARYIHLRPYGSYTVWTNGQSMYVNGYPFFIMLLRVLKNVVFEGNRWKQFGMVGGFIQYWVRGEPKLDTAEFAYRWEVDRLRRFLH